MCFRDLYALLNWQSLIQTAAPNRMFLAFMNKTLVFLCCRLVLTALILLLVVDTPIAITALLVVTVMVVKILLFNGKYADCCDYAHCSCCDYTHC